MVFDRRDLPFLSQASNQAIQTAFDGLSNNFHDESWISTNNSYCNGCSDKVKIKYLQGGQCKSDADLVDFIAASVPLHCIDGWSYLSHAIECHCRGDIANSKHLAYYAELRATLSILASQGIGIFNHRHVIVKTTRDCISLYNDSGTHVAAWDLLEKWVDSSDAFDLITTIIQPRNIPLSYWLSSFSGTNSYQITISKLLTLWGLDLKIIGTKDKEARNESSYHPQRITKTVPQNFQHDLNYLCEFWNIFEYGGSGFEKLDYHLLQLGLIELFALSCNNSGFRRDSGLTKQFKSRINSLMDKQGISGEEKKRIANLLLKNDGVDLPLIIREANKQDPMDSYNQHMQMLSRASLLLRIASGTSANLFQKANFPIEDLKFWWNPIGIQRGFWESEDEPDNFGDLWEDISNALVIAKPYSNKEGISLYNFHQEDAYSLAKLVECERIALWGFGF